MKKKHQPVKIFVVEDDPMYSRMVKYIMELNPDHEVYSFKTGKECIDNLHLQRDNVPIWPTFWTRITHAAKTVLSALGDGAIIFAARRAWRFL